MTLKEIMAVMADPDRIRIMKENKEIYNGYLGCLVYSEEYEKNPGCKSREVKRYIGCYA